MPAGQVHAPPTQVDGAPHALPQPPQLKLSVFVLTHALLQLVNAPHISVHTDALQTSGGTFGGMLFTPGHTFPHAPQFVGLCVRLTHWPLQRVWPVGHAQAPITHCWPPPHARPHAPQLFGSVTRLTQALLQLVRGTGAPMTTQLRAQ